jgi:hypothetical protein
MSNETGFTEKHQDVYFRDCRCPFCGSDDLLMGRWDDVGLRTSEREIFCDQCEEGWKEVHYKDVGQRFLEYEGTGLEALIAEEERQAKQEAQAKAILNAREEYLRESGFYPGLT